MQSISSEAKCTLDVSVALADTGTDVVVKQSPAFGRVIVIDGAGHSVVVVVVVVVVVAGARVVVVLIAVRVVVPFPPPETAAAVPAAAIPAPAMPRMAPVPRAPPAAKPAGMAGKTATVALLRKGATGTSFLHSWAERTTTGPYSSVRASWKLRSCAST